MSVDLRELHQYLDHCLRPDRFQDYCPNGLQVEGRPVVTRLVTGVTACQDLIDEAAAWGADALLVHHGYFWRSEAPEVVGMKKRRLTALLHHDMSLLAYHLPLDAHPRMGNNACLGRLMGIANEDQEPLQPGAVDSVGNIATLARAESAGAFVSRVEGFTGRQALHIGDAAAPVRRIAWCTGAAQSYLEAAVAAGADLFVTGEVSEATVHIAREEGIHFVAAGHHATERYGVQAVGEHLQEHFGLQHRFIDIDNPV